MENLAKILVKIGIMITIIGVGILLINKLGLPIGKLPGDIVFRRGNTTIYFPIITCILLSIILSLVLWLFRK